MLAVEHHRHVPVIIDRHSSAKIVCGGHNKLRVGSSVLRETERGLYTRSEQLQARQILRIDNAHWDVVFIDHNQIVDAMAFKQV